MAHAPRELHAPQSQDSAVVVMARKGNGASKNIEYRRSCQRMHHWGTVDNA
jgi:hypothetical protein